MRNWANAFSPTASRKTLRPSTGSQSPPMPSLRMKSARSASGRCSQSHRTPQNAPSSSSAVAAYLTVPANGAPERLSRARATASAATWFFMSVVPTPQTKPSFTTPANGGTLHSPASAGTTSRCPIIVSVRPGRSPSSRVTRLCRSGSSPSSSLGMPFAARYACTTSAASVSLPLVVSTRRSAVNSSRTSSSSACHSCSSRPYRTTVTVLARGGWSDVPRPMIAVCTSARESRRLGRRQDVVRGHGRAR